MKKREIFPVLITLFINSVTISKALKINYWSGQVEFGTFDFLIFMNKQIYLWKLQDIDQMCKCQVTTQFLFDTKNAYFQKFLL